MTEASVESLVRLEAMLSQVPGVVWTTDRDLRFTSSRGTGLATVGREPDQVVGLTLQQYLGTNDPDAPPIVAHRRALSGELASYDYEFENRDWHCRIAPLRASSGEVVGCIGSALDVTECRVAQRAAAEGEQRFRELIESIADCVFSVRVDQDSMRGDVDYVGPQIEAMLGIPPQRFLEEHGLWIGLVHPDDRAIVTEKSAALLMGPTCMRREYRLRSASGEYRWIADRVESKVDASGKVERFVGVARDITDRKSADDQLRRNTRELASYHDLINHDLSNLTMKLLGLFELLLDEAAGPVPEPQRQLLMTANRQALELERLSGNARLLARVDEEGRLPETSAVPLRGVVEHALDAVKALHFDLAIETEVHVPPGIAVTGVPFLESIVHNLIDNAVRYHAGGRPAQVEIRAGGGGGEAVKLSILGGVLDGSIAIDAFFDRYARGRRSTGFGLGLTVCRAIVERTGGAITAHAVPQGEMRVCEIRLELPSG